MILNARVRAIWYYCALWLQMLAEIKNRSRLELGSAAAKNVFCDLVWYAIASIELIKDGVCVIRTFPQALQLASFFPSIKKYRSKKYDLKTVKNVIGYVEQNIWIYFDPKRCDLRTQKMWLDAWNSIFEFFSNFFAVCDLSLKSHITVNSS